MKKSIFVFICLLFISGCTTIPNGPSMMALPGTGKSFDQFRYDDNSCQQYGLQQSGVSANKAANDSMASSAVVGTVVGAAIGAAVGGRGGAAVGAGTGLLVGTVEGSNAAAISSYTTQQRYDNAYIQCMYAKGHRVPVPGNFVTETQRTNDTRRPQRNYNPPPPPP